KKKNLELDFGDVWQSVWSSIARTILHRIDRKGLEERNWRPNIILFSGGTKNRPHLIQFGKDLVGNQGFLSNFDLILNKSSNVLFKKRQQAITDEISKDNEGIFTRKQECKDIYEGIEAISSTYGFSGVEPNTILFGWARQSENPVRFAKMIRVLSELDLNILMMDYDKDVGFGKKEIIDVWCRGGGNNCNLVLSLIKFMWLSDNWKDARIRILMVNPINDEKEMMIRDVENMLEDARMDAEIKIINNQIEKRPINELIEVESSNSDIVFLGIPQINEGEEEEYVKQVNRLCQNVGTVVLVKASSYFKDIEIGRSDGMARQEKSDYTEGDIDLVISRKIKVPEIEYPADSASEQQVRSLYDMVREMNEKVFATYIADLFNLNRSVYAGILESANHRLNMFREKIPGIKGTENWKESISEAYREIFTEIIEVLKQQEVNTYPEQQKILEGMTSMFKKECDNIIRQCPEIIIKMLSPEEMKIQKGDKPATVLFKLRKRFLSGNARGMRKQKVRFRKLVASHFNGEVYAELIEVFQNWGMISTQQVIKTQGLNNRIFDTFFLLNKLSPGDETATMLQEKQEGFVQYKEQIDKLNEASLQTFYTLLMNKTLFLVRNISNELKEPNTSFYIKTNEKKAAEFDKQLPLLNRVPKKWKDNQVLLNNYTRLELMLFNYITRSKDILSGLYTALDGVITRTYIANLNKILAASGHSTRIFIETMTNTHALLGEDTFERLWDEYIDKALDELGKHTTEVIEKIEIMERQIFDNFKETQFSEHRSINLRARKLADHILQNEFIDPIESLAVEFGTSLRAEIAETLTITERCISLTEMLKNDKSIASDLPQLNNCISSFKNQISEAEKNKLRFLNQLKERTNALPDKFSLHTITRRSSYIKKFFR
ncbi:MAG TPA: hypothetical protein VK994_04360, partial [Bacteroidales bacterium]|nr:hypothetical protein [Bacteroidales bacterium]